MTAEKSSSELREAELAAAAPGLEAAYRVHHCWTRCPKSGTGVPVERCLSCPSAVAIHRNARGEYCQAICAASDPSYVDDEVGVIHLRRARVREVMTLQVPSVRVDGPVEALGRLFMEVHLKSLPVVDSEGLLVGMVNEPEVQFDLRVRGHSERVVADLMTVVAASVREDMPITLAAAILLGSHVTCVPVLSEHQALVGMLDVRDILRWLAQGDGYVTG